MLTYHLGPLSNPVNPDDCKCKGSKTFAHLQTLNSKISLELASEVEADVLEVDLRHLEHVATVGEEHVATFDILGHELVLTLLECFELGSIVALNPASLVEAHRLPTTLGIVLILQAILDNLKLELTYSTDNLAAVELVYEELCHTLTHKLVNTP